MKFTDIHGISLSEYSNKSISLSNTEDGKPLKFQIPRMYMPFGVNGFVPPQGATRWNIDLAMKGYEEDGNYVKKFYDFVKKLENQIIEHVEVRSKEIFGKNISRDDLEKMFNSNIKESMSEYEPKFRVKIDDKANIFDTSDTECTPNPLYDGAFKQHSGVILVELGNVYFINKMFGVTWKVSQMKIYEPQRLKGFMFKDV